MNHIKFIAVTLLIGCAFQTSNAQQITGSSLFSPAGGGARILFAQGDTPANPSIGFHASPSTVATAKNDGGGGLGMYRPTSNTLAFATLSLERMRITVGGNVGIGTAVPTANLQLGENTGNGLINLGSHSTVGCVRSTGDLFLGKNVFAQYGSANNNDEIKTLGTNFTGFSSLQFKTGEMSFFASIKALAANTKINTPDYNIFNIATNGNATELTLTQSPLGATGSTGAALVLKTTQDANYRGSGVFMYDKGGKNEWFAGRPYGSAIGSDQFVIFRRENEVDHNPVTAALIDGSGTTATGTAAMLMINKNGGVGIGTDKEGAGRYKLFVDKSGNIKEGVKFFDSWYNRGMRFGITYQDNINNTGSYAYSLQTIAGSNETPENLSINPMGGNVGIGTVTPNDKLHIHNGAIMLSGTNAAGGPMIKFSDDLSADKYPNGRWGIEYMASNGLDENGKEKRNGGLNFWKPFNGNRPDGTDKGGSNFHLFIKDDGKVSIGLDAQKEETFKGDYKLYVADGIMTEKVKVAIKHSSDWADYVFKADYKLLNLNEVNQFIKNNGHLPGIPSAKEVSKEGIDVAKMDAKLLEKIEELTLYLIKQQNQIQDLQKEIQILKR